MSRPVSVPVDTVRDHLAPFVDAGWSYAVIAAASGVSQGTVVNVMRRNRPRVKAGTATELLRLDWTDLVKHQHAAGKVPALGSRRRIEALIWNGWTVDAIAERAGIHHANVDRILHGHRPTITTRTAQAIDTAYRGTWDKRPPVRDWKDARNATTARNRAAARGYAPPLAWDQIDDPTATPDLGERDGRDGVRAEDVEWLTRYEEHTWDTLSARFGVTRSGIDQALRRQGRRDLIARLTTTTLERGVA